MLLSIIRNTLKNSIFKIKSINCIIYIKTLLLFFYRIVFQTIFQLFTFYPSVKIVFVKSVSRITLVNYRSKFIHFEQALKQVKIKLSIYFTKTTQTQPCISDTSCFDWTNFHSKFYRKCVFHCSPIWSASYLVGNFPCKSRIDHPLHFHPPENDRTFQSCLQSNLMKYNL